MWKAERLAGNILNQTKHAIKQQYWFSWADDKLSLQEISNKELQPGSEQLQGTREVEQLPKKLLQRANSDDGEILFVSATWKAKLHFP